jgi:hypothetical protein
MAHDHRQSLRVHPGCDQQRSAHLARKVVYSLILAVVLAVCAALASATSNLGWLLGFGLQAAFLWTVFVQRNKLTSDLLAGTLGPSAARESTNRLQALYYLLGRPGSFSPGRAEELRRLRRDEVVLGSHQLPNRASGPRSRSSSEGTIDADD